MEDEQNLATLNLKKRPRESQSELNMPDSPSGTLEEKEPADKKSATDTNIGKTPEHPSGSLPSHSWTAYKSVAASISSAIATGAVAVCGCGMFGMMAGATTTTTTDISGQIHSTLDEVNLDRLKAIPSLQHLAVTDVALGTAHGLALGSDGLVYSWGDNANGQLGLGDTASRAKPQTVSSLEAKTVTSISAGMSHSVVATSTGHALAWGSGEFGQLGISTSESLKKGSPPDFSDKVFPATVKQLSPAVTPVVQTASGERHTLCLTSTGAVFVCGDGSRGQLGLGEKERKPAVSSPPGGAAGEENKVRGRVVVPLPISLFQLVPIMSVAAGGQHSLAVTVTGALYSWGLGKRGQLGHGSALDVPSPKRVESLGEFTVVQVSAGGNFSAALVLDPSEATLSTGKSAVLLSEQQPAPAAKGILYMWGGNEHGQLGIGDTDTHFAPKRVTFPVPAGESVRWVRCGAAHTLAGSSDGKRLYAWGSGEMGQLGLGPDMLTDQTRPLLVPFQHVLSPSTITAPASKLPSKAHSSADVSEGRRKGDWFSADGAFVVGGSAGSETSAVIVSRASPAVWWPPSSPLPRVSHLQCFRMAHLLSRLEHGRSTTDWSPAISYVGHVFSDPAILNASFLMQHGDGIDASKVEAAYKAILSEGVRAPQLIHALWSSLQKTVAYAMMIVKKGQLPADPTCFRCIAIVINCPLFSQASQKEAVLLSDICEIIRRVPPALREALSRWWSLYSPELFGARCVRMLARLVAIRLARDSQAQGAGHPSPPPTPDSQSFLSSDRLSRILPVKEVSDEIVSAMELLSLCHQTNESLRGTFSSDRSSNRLHRAAFYVAGLSEHVDWMSDYVRWVTPQPTRAQLPPFAFCRHGFAMDPMAKGRVLRLESDIAKNRGVISAVLSHSTPVTAINVRRSHLLTDALLAFSNTPLSELKRPLLIKFAGEPGVDQGGLTTEFFQVLIKELTQPSVGLFEYRAEQRQLWYRKAAPTESLPQHLRDLYFFAGVAIGLAVFHGVTVFAPFPRVIFDHLLQGNQLFTFSDSGMDEGKRDGYRTWRDWMSPLQDFDSRLSKSLEQILSFEGNVEETFGLNFAVAVPLENEGKHTVETTSQATAPPPPSSSSSSSFLHVELIKNGASVAVDNDNRLQYVKLYTKHLLYGSVKPQSEAFVSGFRAICNGPALKLFASEELERLICGSAILSFRDWQRVARYEGGYHAQHPFVLMFWDVVHHLSESESSSLLEFITGSARVPMGGLSELPVTIQRASGDSNQIPTAHTCFHTLLLPEYASREKLLAKLRVALVNSQGFGMD